MEDFKSSGKKPEPMIHITDGRTDEILDFIPLGEFWNDKHYKSLKDNVETFDFITFADKSYSKYLADRNRIVIPDEDGKYVEFIIQNTRKYRSGNGSLVIEVYSSASYIGLAKANVISPQTLQSKTAKEAAETALKDTEWEVGQVDFAGIRTLQIEKYTNPYSLLKTIASEFDLELHFRVEIDGNKVSKRYVDLLEKVGNWQGREVEFGKDLVGIERKVDDSNIVTTLIGLGPESEDGNRLQVTVQDENALQRWGRRSPKTGLLMPIIDIYEPESTDTEMTEERLRALTENELKKRINSIVEYSAEVADLEKVPGLEHEKFRLGDTIRIKDTTFNPPLYLEARIHTQERSISDQGQKKVTLGDYVEYTEEEVEAIWKSLQAQIAKKISMADVLEVTYTKEEIDEKDIPGKEAKAKIDQDVGDAIIETTDGSQDKADQAERNAKNHADSVANQVYNYASSEIQQLAGQVSTKAEASTVTALGNRVTTAENNISALQGEITQKVSQSTFDALENRVTQAESTITQTADNVTVAFNRIDSIDGVLNSAVTTIDASGVTVKDGSFYLEDDTSDTKYSIVSKTNLLGDHSFEMIERIGSIDPIYGDFAVEQQIDSYRGWRTVGSPRLLSARQTDWIQFSLFYHGLQAIVVSSTDYVEQQFPYIPGKTYTVSAYFTGSPRSASGIPRINVRLEQGVTGEVKKTWAQNFPSVTYRQKLTRYALTFTVPADADNSLGGDVVVVAIQADSGWVVADGVQVVEGETPVLYDPENAVWALLRGDKGYEFPSLVVNGLVEAPTIRLTGGAMIQATRLNGNYFNDSMVLDHNNGNVSFNALGGNIFLGLYNTQQISAAGKEIYNVGQLTLAYGSGFLRSADGALVYINGFSGEGLYFKTSTGWKLIVKA